MIQHIGLYDAEAEFAFLYAGEVFNRAVGGFGAAIEVAFVAVFVDQLANRTHCGVVVACDVSCAYCHQVDSIELGGAQYEAKQEYEAAWGQWMFGHGYPPRLHGLIFYFDELV